MNEGAPSCRRRRSARYPGDALEANQLLVSTLARELLALKLRVKIAHWETHGYAAHKSLDWLFGRLVELNDRCIETAMGIYGRVSFPQGASLPINDLEAPVATHLERAAARLRKIRTLIKDTDLQNVIDSIMGALHRTIYLLSLS